jgi:hypothetical protein
MKLGATVKLAEHRMLKEADGPLSFLSPSNLTKAIIGVSVLGGVPMGIAAHVISKRITEQRSREKELLEQAKYYRGATQGLERGLATT